MDKEQQFNQVYTFTPQVNENNSNYKITTEKFFDRIKMYR
jgi:hypothetical protein